MSITKGIELIKKEAQNAPETWGVYRMLDEKKQVLYIGKAKNLKKRLTSYTRLDNMSMRIRRMVEQTYFLEIIITESEDKALLLESSLIKKLSPRYNILLKDDKSFPFILLSKEHSYPKITKHRGKQLNNGKYFGPFTSAGAVNKTLSMLQKAFLLRSCSDSDFNRRTRPCLLFQIKRCSAPCVNYISLDDYLKLVNQADDFLSGKNHVIQKDLETKMAQFSSQLDFENAAKIRDRLKALNLIAYKTNDYTPENADVIALFNGGESVCIEVFFYRAGSLLGNAAFFPETIEHAEDDEILSAFLWQFYETQAPPPEVIISHKILDLDELTSYFSEKYHNKVSIPHRLQQHQKGLIENAIKNAKKSFFKKNTETGKQLLVFQSLAKMLCLEKTPERIEFYDNSHLFGTNAVSAMIPANSSGIITKGKRKFYIKNQSSYGNDVAMMEEVITRRFKRELAENPEKKSTSYPDIIIVDGGKAQITAAKKVFAALEINDIKIVGAAKNKKHGYEKLITESGAEIIPEQDNPAFIFIQNLGQKTHDFVIGFHRTKKVKSDLKSSLDDIDGIGPIKKRALLHHFCSIKAIADASIDELQQVQGINQKNASKIFNYFHKNKN